MRTSILAARHEGNDGSQAQRAAQKEQRTQPGVYSTILLASGVRFTTIHYTALYCATVWMFLHSQGGVKRSSSPPMH